MTSQAGFLTYQSDVCVDPAWKEPFLTSWKEKDGFPNSFSFSLSRVKCEHLCQSPSDHFEKDTTIQQEQVHKLLLIQKLNLKNKTPPTNFFFYLIGIEI